MAGGGEQTSTVYQSNLPEYAKPYYQSMMNRALGESERPYQAYKGQRLAGMSSQTQQGLDMTRNYAQSGLGSMQTAQGLAGLGGQAATNFINQGAPNITNSYGGPAQGNYTAGQFGTGNFDAAARDQYMSPYMQAVTDRAKEDAVLNAMQEQQYRSSQAAAAGSFGGSRAAVQQQMATGDLMRNLSNIDVQGRQAAFENAQQQFERDRQATMQAQGMGEQSRQFGYGATEDAYRAAAQLGLTAQEAQERFRQSGFELGHGALNQSAQNLANLQGMSDEMMQARMKAMLGIGSTVEGYKQQQLDMAYNDFINQRDVERQNLQFLSSILRGVPISANQNVTQTTPTNPLAGLLGSFAGLNALYNLNQQK